MNSDQVDSETEENKVVFDPFDGKESDQTEESEQVAPED
jgi:hypothetical protein